MRMVKTTAVIDWRKPNAVDIQKSSGADKVQIGGSHSSRLSTLVDSQKPIFIDRRFSSLERASLGNIMGRQPFAGYTAAIDRVEEEEKEGGSMRIVKTTLMKMAKDWSGQRKLPVPWTITRISLPKRVSRKRECARL